MKIAILSDIHGNYDALDAVLKTRDFSEVEHLFILGDLVGYYYEPHKVMETVSQYSFDLILGNHEVFLQNTDPNQLEKVRKKYGQGIDVALQKLNPTHLALLKNAPQQKIVKKDQVNAMLCHGSPWQVDEYIYPNAPLQKLQDCAQFAVEKQCNFLFMGHTHYPFTFYHNGCIVSNPGSVGQARDTGGFACWQLLDTESLVLVQKKTRYDIKKLQQSVREQDPDLNYLWTILERE